MKLIYAVTTTLVLVNACLIARGQSDGEIMLDPNLPFQAERSNPVNYDVDFSIVVTAPYKTKKLRVWVPLPPNDDSQYVSDRQLTTFPMSVEPQIGTEPLYGNTFAYFEFDSPQGAQVIRHRFKIRVWQLNWNLDASRIVFPPYWPPSFEKYHRSESQSVVIDDRFRKMLDEIVPARTNGANDFASVIQWVQNNFEYDYRDVSSTASSVHGLEKRRGNCGDYHGFCAALGRALGLPTRVVYGIHPFPKNSPTHCKLEAYLAPYGWVSFDVSETQKLMKLIDGRTDLKSSDKQRLITLAKTRMSRGFRDNTWFTQTRGTDYDLVPKSGKRVPLVRTAYMEADGVAMDEPDPADDSQTKFSWMTVHDYHADKQVPYPFSDWNTLEIDTEKK